MRTTGRIQHQTPVSSNLNMLLLCCLWVLTSSRIVPSYAWVLNSVLMSSPKAHLTYASSVQAGARNGIEECKQQFAWDRWNCPESALHLTTPGRLRAATREISFVHAISAAGVMFTLTKNCSLGELANCGCDVSRNGKPGGRGWMWGGCSDDQDFGARISRQYVDALETGQDTRALMNLHNNDAGRQAVKATMRRVCRCHGLSQSCNMQTCWMQLAEFRDVGNYLKVKHDQAQKLEMDKKRVRAGNSADNRNALADAFNSIARTELIYLEDSPDYCTRNLSLGLYGTEERECLQNGDSLSQWDRRSCRRLCHECGLRVEQRRVETSSSCNCKFNWCCNVTCDTCTQVTIKHVCTRKHGGHGQHRRRNRGNKSVRS